MSVSIVTTIKNEKGIHARPSSEIATMAMKFKSKVRIYSDDKIADAKDVLQIIMLELFEGTEVKIEADGIDEKEALESIESLISRDFNFD